MISLTVPNEKTSSQTIDLDGDGTEYKLTFRWISRYQRFYLSILDNQGIKILSGVKLAPGAPINLGQILSEGPQGLFILTGPTEYNTSSINRGENILYYLPRKVHRFPLDRAYTIDTDTNQFLRGDLFIPPTFEPNPTVNVTPVSIISSASPDPTSTGDILSVIQGTWTGDNVTLTGQWYLDGSPIEGEVGLAIIVQAEYLDLDIYYEETASSSYSPDVSVNSNIITPIEVIILQDMFGFNNDVTDTVTIPYDASFNGTNRTFECWFIVNDTGFNPLISRWDSSGEYSWRLFVNGGSLGLSISTNGTSQSSIYVSGVVVGQIHHAMISFDDTASYVYLDSRTPNTTASLPYASSSSDITIGEADGTISNSSISEVRFYTDTLYHNDSIRLHNNTDGRIPLYNYLPTTYKSIAGGAWSLTEQDPSGLDLTSNGLDATLGSGSTFDGGPATFGPYFSDYTTGTVFYTDSVVDDVVMMDPDTRLTILIGDGYLGTNPYGCGGYQDKMFSVKDDSYYAQSFDPETLGRTNKIVSITGTQPRGCGGTLTVLMYMELNSARLFTLDPETLIESNPVSSSRGSNPRGCGGTGNQFFTAAFSSNEIFLVDQVTKLNIGSSVTGPNTNVWGVGGSYDSITDTNRAWMTDQGNDSIYEMDPNTRLPISSPTAGISTGINDIGGTKV